MSNDIYSVEENGDSSEESKSRAYISAAQQMFKARHSRPERFRIDTAGLPVSLVWVLAH